MSSIPHNVEFGKHVDINLQRRRDRQAIGILAKRNARFVAIRHGSKLPRDKGWNKTENTLSAADALAHLATGGSVGHAAGTGNVYWFDIDRDAERAYECPQLSGGFHIRRDNAPDKVKFAFTCDAVVPTRPRSQKHGFDLLGVNANGTHAQAVIAGMHPSGDPYRWGGHTVPHLHIDTVAALFEEWTDGEDLFPPAREPSELDPTYADADLARVADALRYVDPNAIDYNTWQGIIAALHDAYGDAALDLAVEWADGQPGEVEDKWGSYDRAYSGKATTLATIFYLARKNGWVDTQLQDRLAAYRRWLASPEAIETLKASGRNPERARKLLDTILQRCETDRRLRIAPGYAWLAKESGISQARLGAYLARLFAAGLIELTPGQEATRDAPAQPTMIELVLHNRNASPIGSSIDIPTVEGSVPVVQNWNVYREFRSDELFINGHAVYNATHPKAELSPLGDNGLAALLVLLDGPLSIAEAAEETGHSYNATARTLRRYAQYGLVCVTTGYRNRKTFTLKEEWREILQANRPKTTTYGVMLFRHDKALASRIKHLQAYGHSERAAKLQAARDKLEPVIKQVIEEAGIIPYRPQRTDKQVERRRRLTRAYVVGERAEYRPKQEGQTEADRWRRKEYAQGRMATASDWPFFAAWAEATRGPGWWVHLDQTDVIGLYRVWQTTGDAAAQQSRHDAYWADLADAQTGAEVAG